MNHPTTVPTEHALLQRIRRSIERFLRVEAASGLILVGVAAIALLWANSPWAHGYEALWHTHWRLGIPSIAASHEAHFWINDALMTVFFLVVGLEIRHEIHAGALSDPRVAVLPLIAALSGVLVPALFYLLVNTDPTAREGWAIPTATDIAFAVGILALTGRGMPAALRMLLLTLAIIDDIVAILVIAFFYSSGIAWSGVLISACGVAMVLAMQRFGFRRALPYVLPGAVLWFGMLWSGIHPTLTGVVLGLMAPASAASSHDGPLRTLHPWVAFLVMPLFALANAGVSIQGLPLGEAVPLAAGAGIVIGLVLGKPVGVVLASMLAVRLRLCSLPEGVHWRHILLLGCLAGIGFTMSIFIATLAFPDPKLLAMAKFAVLTASTLAAILGLMIGRWAARSRERSLPGQSTR